MFDNTANWYSIKDKIISQLPVIKMFECKLLKFSNLGNLYFYQDQVKLDHDEILNSINKYKFKLSSNGIGPGSKVVIALPNSLEFCFYLFASWDLGACVIPLPPQSTIFEIMSITSELKPNLIVWKNGVEEYLSSPVFNHFDYSLILYTSGSSGSPKGVVISRETLEKKMMTYKAHLPLNDFQTTLCSLPLNFGHGLISNFLFPLFSGCDVILTDSGNKEVLSRWGEIIDDYKVTAYSSVPSILKAVGNFASPPKYKSLRRAFSASAPLSFEVAQISQSWNNGIEIHNMYGMTELASWCSGNLSTGRIYQESNVGTPLSCEIKIMKENENEHFGEILIRADYHLSGYFNDPVATANIFCDGWIKSGDIGSLNELGEIILMGRTDNVINLAGVKISPEEINQVVKTHPAIADCFTIGLKMNPKEADYAIGTIIILKENKALNRDEIRLFCKEHLSSNKIPAQVKFLKELPLTPRGKVDKFKVTNILQETRLKT